MSLRRSVVFAALAVALAGCHDEEFVTVVETPPTKFSAPSSATGLTGFDDTIGAADVGSDGLPRLVFTRTAGDPQVLFTRQASSGTWSAPLALSIGTGAKTLVSAFVTTSNNYTHVFWVESGAVHYVRVTNADPPAVDPTGSDAVISTGTATELVAAVDRSTHTVFAMWIDSVAGVSVPVVREVPAAGPVGPATSLVVPAGGLPVCSSPLLRVSSAGVVHAAWVGTDAAGNNSLLRYSRRASAGSWSDSPGEAVSDVLSADNFIEQADLLLAGDGGVYAVWYDTDDDLILADYRSSTVGFGADDTVVSSVPVLTQVRAALEPGTQFLHVIWREGTAGGTVSFKAQRQDGANLGGDWLAVDETVFSVATAAGDSIDFAAWADSTNRVVLAYQAPTVEGDLSRTLLRVHASGAAAFGSATDLTVTYALPCAGLMAAVNSSGTAVLAWEQGAGDVAPVSEVCAMVYSSGGSIGGSSNISQTPATASFSPGLVLMPGSGVAHAFWYEETSAGANDIYHTRTQ